MIKISQTVEQGIYVVLILAMEKDHKPLKSYVLSSLLQVSDSYLKKVLRKMVVGGVVKSSASKDGGFQLTRSVEEITLYDVFVSIVGDRTPILSQIGDELFEDNAALLKNRKKVKNTFIAGFSAFDDELRKLKFSDLLSRKSYENPSICWEERVKRE